jgi:hypothetical protein
VRVSNQQREQPPCTSLAKPGGRTNQSRKPFHPKFSASKPGSNLHHFGSRERGLKHTEQLFLLTHNGIGGSELFLQRQSGLRLGQAQNSFTVQQLDQVKLDFMLVNHTVILPQSCAYLSHTMHATNRDVKAQRTWAEWIILLI